jgi:hypothetical protein
LNHEEHQEELIKIHKRERLAQLPSRREENERQDDQHADQDQPSQAGISDHFSPEQKGADLKLGQRNKL